MPTCPVCQTLLPATAGLGRCTTCGAGLPRLPAGLQPRPVDPRAAHGAPPSGPPRRPPTPSPTGAPFLGGGASLAPWGRAGEDRDAPTPVVLSGPSAASGARLVLRGSAGEVIEFSLAAGGVIGRSTGATIQLSDREVSRRHTAIEVAGAELVIRDLGSSNGTFVNGRRLYGPVNLRDGDEVMVGATRLVFRLGRQEGPVVRSTEENAPVVASVDTERVFAPADQIRDVDQLRRDYERLRIAHDFQRFVRLERDLHALLAKILDVAFDLIPAENGVILLRDARTNELVVEAVRQRAATHQRDSGAKVLVSETMLEHVATGRQGVLTSDALGDARFSASDSIIGLGVRSCMAVPLLSGDEVRGVMFLDSRERIGAFTVKDLEILSAIASQATVALENSELAKRIEESAQKRAFLERFLSPQLARQVEQGKLELTKGGSLTQVTVLFCDIRGFTAMCEHAAPQETVALLNEYFEAMADCVFACDGIVDKFIGDEVMALFGVPVRGVDDPERAVRCAVVMQEKTREFNETRRALGRAPIAVGIGVHTGEAVVGVMGSTKRLEYTAVGDTVNVAKRLCSAAPPDEIVISEATRQLAGAGHRLEELPPLTLKGRRAQLKPFRIVP